jgi:hypothetical protein
LVFGRSGSWPCDNAAEGVSAGRDRGDALQGDGFEHIFSDFGLEGDLVHHRANLTGSQAVQSLQSGRLRSRSPRAAA